MVNENFTIVGVILFLYGIFICLKDRFTGWTLILLLIGSGPGFLILANVTLSTGSEALLKKFFFTPFIFLILIIAMGLKKLPRYVSGLTIALPFFLLYNNFPELNTRQSYLYNDYARDILRTLPRNTILFADRADEMEFSIANLHLSRGFRPDLGFVDCNAGVSKSIYGDDYYRIWGKPRLAIRERIEKSIIENTKRPVYYATFEPAMINIPRIQEGLVYRVKPISWPKDKFPYDEIYYLRRPDKLSVRKLSLLLSYYELMGKYYLSIDDPVKADKFFTGLSVYDKSGYADTSIGFQFHSKNLIELAEKYYKAAISKKTADIDTYVNLGTIYEKKGNNDKAKDVYNAVLSIDPNNVQTHYNLAVLYWKEADWKKVISEFETVLELNPNRADARRYLELARAKVHK
jgi:TPR repeat protein